MIALRINSGKQSNNLRFNQTGILLTKSAFN
jgi:hypothetical protein